MDEGVGFIYTRSVRARTMSHLECVFNTSLPNSNSAAALRPCRPSMLSTTSQVFNVCEVAPVRPHPHAPSPSLNQQPCTHPVDDNPPLLPTARPSRGRHRGDVAHRRPSWPHNPRRRRPIHAPHSTQATWGHPVASHACPQAALTHFTPPSMNPHNPTCAPTP